MLKKFLTLCLILIISLSSIPMVALADSEKSVTIKELKGYAFKNDEQINYESTAAYNVNVQQLELTYVGNKFEIKGKLNYGNDKTNFVTMGDFYPVEGGGAFDDKLIYGDFTDTDRYNFAQIKIISDCSMGNLLRSNKGFVYGYVISMSIEDMNNGTLYYIQGMLNATDYNKILTLSKDQVNSKMSDGLSKRDIDIATLGLFNAENKFMKRTHESHPRTLTNQTPEKSYELKVPDPADVTAPDEDILNIQGTAISLNELDTFLSNLKSNGTVSASNYSSAIKSIMMNTGWNNYTNPQAPAYFYYQYGYKNGAYLYEQEISLFDWTNTLPTSKTPRTQISLRKGQVIEYNTLDNTYTLVYNDFGIALSNIQLEAYGCSGSNVFISRTVSGVFQQKDSSFSSIVSLIPYVNTVYSAWENIQSVAGPSGSTSQLGQILLYDGTASLQKARYNGSVIRGIVGAFGSSQIAHEGQYCNLVGETSLAMSTAYFAFRVSTIEYI